jgi:WD40 repeat protein
MVEPPRKRVLVSYARKDAARLATELQRDLQPDHDVWLDINRIADGASWTAEVEKEIDNCDVFLALLSPGSYVSDICRAEQLRALRCGKRVIALLAVPDANRPLHLETVNYHDFTVFPPAPHQLWQLRDDILTGRDAAVLPQRFRKTYVTAPPLPLNYIERPDALANLRSAVILDEPGPSIALTGMGGIGKTILARALGHDEVVQQAFPDGIAWTTMGKGVAHNLAVRMQEVCRALGDEPDPEETEIQCINRYRTLLEEKAALVIVDDIWRAADIEPFLAESRRSRLLFTARDGAIAAATGAVEHMADPLTPDQARALLARWAGYIPDALPAEAAELVQECGRLPLALSMTGAMLRGKPLGYWGHVLGLLRLSDLAKMRAQFPSYPHADVMRAVQVSVDALEAAVRRHYLALAVLPDDMPAPPAVQQTLWGVTAGEALETAEQFVSLSLAQQDADGRGIRLHDLQLDWVRAQPPDRAALELIHEALRLSSRVIERDPSQFAPQLVGRLLPYCDTPAIGRFTGEIAATAPRPWLRPLQPALYPPGRPLLRTLDGHAASVSGVALMADGQQAVSASEDRTLQVWDLESGRALRTLEGHAAFVACVAVTADDRRAVSGSGDNTLKVWDLESGRALRTLEGHASYVYGVAVTADGQRAVSASEDRTLKVWDLESGRALCTLEGHASYVYGVAVTSDGQRAVSASWDNTLKVWDLESGRALRTLDGHAAYVYSVAVTADCQRVVSASWDNTLKVWDLESGRVLRTLEGHSSYIYGVAVTADGRRAVSASHDRTLQVWDLESGRALRTLEGHSSYVYGVAVTADGRRAVSASEDRTLKVWDLKSGCALRTLEGNSFLVSAVAVTADGRRAVSASGDNTLKVWDLESGRVLRTLEGNSFPVSAVAVTADGRRAVSASLDKTLQVWDLENGRAQRTLGGHASYVYGVALTPDGRRAVSASWDKTLKVWDLENGCTLRTLEGHASCVYRVAVTADGRRAVSASYDNTLKVWDLESGRTLRTLEGHASFVSGVAMTADGRRAVSASYDKTLKVWDLESGRALRTLEGHANWVSDVAVTADGQRAVSASGDNTLKVWDLDSGLPVASFHCDASVLCCAIARGRTIIAGDGSGRVHFLVLEERGGVESGGLVTPFARSSGT